MGKRITQKDIRVPIDWDSICRLHDMDAFESVDVWLNKKGIALLMKAAKQYTRDKKYDRHFDVRRA